MFQSLINNIYRQPKSQFNTWQKFGGYFAYQNMIKASREMELAAQSLNIEAPQNNLPPLQVSFLTGQKFWYQTVFCAYSLQKSTSSPIHFVFYDDGSLSKVNTIKEQVPKSTIVSIEEIHENLNEKLPIDAYPYLHKKREVYKHIRKLTDVYTHGKEWKLMLDSDMLFWKEPTQMLGWLQNPDQPFYILDSITSYGYPLEKMGELSSSAIKEKINVGALGLHTDMVDFDKLEYWAKTLETNYGTSYYLEQALSAMLIGDKKAIIGSASDYIVYPTKEQVENKAGILHHYVDVSKKWYFETAWKQIL